MSAELFVDIALLQRDLAFDGVSLDNIYPELRTLDEITSFCDHMYDDFERTMDATTFINRLAIFQANLTVFGHAIVINSVDEMKGLYQELGFTRLNMTSTQLAVHSFKHEFVHSTKAMEYGIRTQIRVALIRYYTSLPHTQLNIEDLRRTSALDPATVAYIMGNILVAPSSYLGLGYEKETEIGNRLLALVT